MKTLREEVEELLSNIDFLETDIEDIVEIGILPPDKNEPNYNIGAMMRYITKNNIKNGLSDEQLKMFIKN